MPRLIRALLVGIDAYPAPVHQLHGCVADINAIERLLSRRAQAAGDSLTVKRLPDQQATRAAVISAFREHLGKAGSGDTALFYYSGHGSQARALPEDAALEPDGLDETIVLYDSRQPGVFDLTDKELAQLVSEVSTTGAHVTVILDCCHSGSGVRALLDDGIAIRRAATDQRPRPPETFLQQQRDMIHAADADSAADWLNLRGARYVLLAACRSDQTAKEALVGGSVRGVMSSALERTLGRIGGTATYQEIQASVAAGVRNLAADQTPVLESPVPEDIHQHFLGGAAAPAEPVLTVSHTADRGWVLDAGLIQGIPAVQPGEAGTTITLHELDAKAASAETLTTATVVSVGVTTSTVDVEADAKLDPSSTYRAFISSIPLARLPVVVLGDNDEMIQAVRAAVESSALLRIADPGEAVLEVTAQTLSVRLSRTGSERPLVEIAQPGLGPGPADATGIVRAAEHVARWRLLADRANPATSLSGDSYNLTCFDEDGRQLVAPIERQYPEPGNRTKQPTIKIRIQNRSNRRLFFVLLALSELYGVTPLLPGPGQWLEAGEEVWATGEDGRPVLYLDVPQGQERATDLVKLIVSSEEFDAQQLVQDPMTPPTRDRGIALAPGVTRGIGRSPQVPTSSDWTTSDLTVTTILPEVHRQVGLHAVDLVPGAVTIAPHSSFTAKVRLSSQSSASRDASVPLQAPLFRDQPAIFEAYAFAPALTRGNELSVLELTDMTRAEDVTPQKPLVLTVDTPLGADEQVLALGYDGADYLPLGVGCAGDGVTEILLHRIPSMTEELARSLGGSVKILFRKLILGRLGFGYDYPRLCLVTFDEHGEPCYEEDPDTIRTAVATAERLLLVVHGIIGDTRGMAAAVGASPIRAEYDAILAYDYENLQTEIKETARSLGERLAQIGISKDDGRQLDVVAHSMGGLVSRWFIEREGGADVVDRLINCGTPNQGSPWPRVEDLATAALGLGLNVLSGLAGPAAVVTKVVGVLVAALERVDVTLDEMRPGSAFLTELAASELPKVRYCAVAGDHPFGPDGDPHQAHRILAKLHLPAKAVAFVFDRVPNDVAVSVPSATTFGSTWTRQPEVISAACNHATYFASPPGIAAVEKALAIPRT